MTRWQLTLEVARWEFARFVKWKQQFIGLAVMVAIGALIGVVSTLIRRAEARPVTVTVVGQEALTFPLPTVDAITWDTGGTLDPAALRVAVAEARIPAAMIVSEAGAVEFVLLRRAAWTERAGGALAAAHREATLARVLSADAIAALAIPLAVETTLIAAGAAPTSRSARIIALFILGTGFILIMNGFGTIFAGITGEKQHRVTEQMLAMVPPQVWMDGKILGLTSAAFVGTGVTYAGLFLLMRALPLALGRNPVAIPAVATDVGLVALIVLTTLLGVLFWFAFMSAIAATIDDPNSSTRSLLLFVPILPLGAAFALLPKAESLLAQALGVFPLTSMAVLPMRLVATTVPWWEVVLALALLVAAAWGCRRLAGRIFGAGMLMFGKEPSLRELLRWMRHT